MRLKTLVGVLGFFFALGCGCGVSDSVWMDTGGWVIQPPETGWWESALETAVETADTGAVDGDGDGYNESEDCDDTDPDIHPDARDTPGDGIDQDCSGSDALIYTAMSAGGDNVCAIQDGDIVCLDSTLEGDWTELWVAESGLTVCGAQGESLSCWGEDDQGILSEAPGIVPDHLALGTWHGCALVGETVNCWGSDLHGQRIPGVGPYAAVASGPHSVCAIAAGTGELVCAGADFSGQSSPPAGAFDVLDLGGNQGCALGAGNLVKCWGEVSGEVPNFGVELKSLTVGEDFVCVLTADGAADCWGEIEAPPQGPWIEISAGNAHACALAEDGLLQCWGQVPDPG